MPARKSAQKGKVVMKGAAKASPVPDAPDDSVLQRTSTYLAEIDALESKDFETFNVVDIDRRIALLARFVIEAVLRDPDRRVALDKKADIALRAISTLEGIKTRGELWVKESKAPVPQSVEEYEKERKPLEKRLAKLLEVKAKKKGS